MATPPGSKKKYTPPAKVGGPPVRRAEPVVTPPGAPGRARELRPATLIRAKAVPRATSRLPIVAAGVLVVALLAVAGFLILNQSNAAPATIGDIQTNEGQVHVPEGTAIQYANNPPSSGNHYPSPKTWGVYEETVPPGNWVHNLEHGGIVVLYDCPEACPEVVKVVRDALQSFPKDKYQEIKLVSTPYKGLPNGAKTAAVAWQWVETFPGSLTTEQLLAFYNAHVNRSPENVP